MNRLAAAAALTTTFGFGFVIGLDVGDHARGCEVVRTNAAAFRSDPAYWGGAMRTLVEACERGE